MKAIFVAIVTLLLLLPAVPIRGQDEKVEVEITDFMGNVLLKKEMSTRQAEKLEKEILNGKFSCGIKFDFGFNNYIISYGKGKVYIPLSKERSFMRLMLRPIIFNYEKGFTITKFGANYAWKGAKIGDYGTMLGRQSGVMLGFYGIHIRIRHALRPDTHIFVGGSMAIIGWNKLL